MGAVELGDRVGGVELRRPRRRRPRPSRSTAFVERRAPARVGRARTRADGPTRSSSAPAGTAARALTTSRRAPAPRGGPRARPRAAPPPAQSTIGSVPGGGGPAMSIRAPGLDWTITPGRGRSDSIRITAATTRSAPKRARSVARCSTPLSSGSTSAGASAATRSSASSSPAALVATIRQSTADRRVLDDRHRRVELAQQRAGHVQPAAAIAAAVSGRAISVTSEPACRQGAGDEAADPAGPEHRDPERHRRQRLPEPRRPAAACCESISLARIDAAVTRRSPARQLGPGSTSSRPASRALRRWASPPRAALGAAAACAPPAAARWRSAAAQLILRRRGRGAGRASARRARVLTSDLGPGLTRLAQRRNHLGASLLGGLGELPRLVGRAGAAGQQLERPQAGLQQPRGAVDVRAHRRPQCLAAQALLDPADPRFERDLHEPDQRAPGDADLGVARVDAGLRPRAPQRTTSASRSYRLQPRRPQRRRRLDHRHEHR